MSAPSQIDSVQDRAAEWADLLQQRGDDLSLRRDFERWRSADPEHARAYECIERGYRRVRTLEGSELQHRLRQETMERIAAQRQRRLRRQRLGFAMAASVVVAVAGVLVLNQNLRHELQYQQARALHALAGETLYRTAVGERQAIELADGSTITLNTDSRVAVAYRDARRDVTLLRGQALFEVAHNPARPFVVQAGERRITALGTAFDVRLTEESVAVTLIHGRVAVEEIQPQAQVDEARLQRAILQPGDQLLALTTVPEPVIRKADTRRATSWKDGLLLFEGENLAQAIAEVNRYGGPRIELADPSLGELRISGAFRTGKPDAFLETLSWYLPIRVVEADDRHILVGPKG